MLLSMVEPLPSILKTIFANKFIQGSNTKVYIYRRLFLAPYFEILVGELAWISSFLVNLQKFHKSEQNTSNSVTG